MNATPSIRWFQFRLRTLLLLLTIVAIGPGGWVLYEQKKARRQQAAVEALQAAGGNVEVYARPNRLWTLLALDAPGNVVGLGLRYNRNLNDDDLAPLADFSDLHWLDLQQTQIGDQGLKHLAGLTRLQRLRLDETRVTDAGLLHLAGMRELRTLNLYKTGVTDKGLVHLAALPNLETLSIQRAQVSDAGVGQLQQAMPNLSIAIIPR
jgi:hypothetical protein